MGIREIEERLFEDQGMNDLLNLLVDAEDEAELEVGRARVELARAWRKLRAVKRAVRAFDDLEEKGQKVWERRPVIAGTR
jgi:hypothetical protein